MLDEESLDPRAPSYVAAVVGDARGGYGLALPRRDDRRVPRHRGAPAPRRCVDEIGRVAPRELVLGRGDDDRALAELVRAARSRGCRAPARRRRRRRRPSCARALGRARSTAALLRARARARRAAAARGAALRARDPAGRRAAARAASSSTRAPTTLVIDEQARAHLELVETLHDRRRAGLAARCARRDAHGDGRAAAAALAAVSARSTWRTIRRRHDAVERLVGAHAARDGRAAAGRDRRPRAAGRAGAARRGDAARSGGAGALAGAAARRWPRAAPTRTPARSAARWPASRICCGWRRRRRRRSGAPTLARRARAHAARRRAGADQGRRLRQRRRLAPSSTSCATSPPAGASRIAAIEARERERTGIASLKVRYNSVFGYYIEVTRSNLAARARPTTAASRRWPTPSASSPPSWPSTRRQILSRRRAARRARARAVRRRCARAVAGRRASACWRSAARVARPTRWRRWPRWRTATATAGPTVDDGGVIELADGRHPVVERLAARRQLRPQRRPPRSRPPSSS